ncbi:MAG: hypothetical protein GY719_42730 [bacterium]|nr:hypothetical protein [bacterium]
MVRVDRKIHLKDATVAVLGRHFLCDASLRGRKVQVRFDPPDLASVLIFGSGQRFQRAFPEPLNASPSRRRLRSFSSRRSTTWPWCASTATASSSNGPDPSPTPSSPPTPASTASISLRPCVSSRGSRPSRRQIVRSQASGTPSDRCPRASCASPANTPCASMGADATPASISTPSRPWCSRTSNRTEKRSHEPAPAALWLHRLPLRPANPSRGAAARRGFEEALRRLRYTIELDGIAVLLAEPGCGKEPPARRVGRSAASRGRLGRPLPCPRHHRTERPHQHPGAQDRPD